MNRYEIVIRSNPADEWDTDGLGDVSTTDSYLEATVIVESLRALGDEWATSEYGLRSVENIRPLALLFGYDYKYLASTICLEYIPGALETGNANTCFLFDLQASFGLYAGWAVSLALLCLLDPILYIFRRLSSGMLIVCTGMFLLCTHSLVSGAYTTVLISHGLLPMVTLAILYLWFVQRSFYTGSFRELPRQTDSTSLLLPTTRG